MPRGISPGITCSSPPANVEPHKSAPLHNHGFTGRDYLYRGILMLHAAKREGKPPDEVVLGQFLIRGLLRTWLRH